MHCRGIIYFDRQQLRGQADTVTVRSALSSEASRTQGSRQSLMCRLTTRYQHLFRLDYLLAFIPDSSLCGWYCQNKRAELHIVR